MSDLALLYDDLAETYAAGRHRFDTTPILEEFVRHLPPGARVRGKRTQSPETGVCAFIRRIVFIKSKARR